MHSEELLHFVGPRVRVCVQCVTISKLFTLFELMSLSYVAVAYAHRFSSYFWVSFVFILHNNSCLHEFNPVFLSIDPLYSASRRLLFKSQKLCASGDSMWTPGKFEKFALLYGNTGRQSIYMHMRIHIFESFWNNYESQPEYWLSGSLSYLFRILNLVVGSGKLRLKIYRIHRT